jgi:hypothetical protein
MLELLTVLMLSDVDVGKPSVSDEEVESATPPPLLPARAADCEMGEAAACHELGLSLRHEGDVAGARSAFLRACELGLRDACHRAEAMAVAAGELELGEQLHRYSEALAENPGTRPLPAPAWKEPRPPPPPSRPPVSEEVQRHSGTGDGEYRSPFGFAGTASAIFPFTPTESPETAFHARVGLRYCLFDRTPYGWGPNLGVALLGGVDAGPQLSFGLDVRIEGVYLGRSMLAEPIMNLFVQGGFAVPLGGAVEWHGGIGLNFDVLASGLAGGSGGGGWGGLGGGGGGAGLVVLAAAVLFATMPSVEVRYTARTDGSSFSSVVVGVGM